jgi:peptidoglycan-N-acetylglucosamine deacetylase
LFACLLTSGSAILFCFFVSDALKSIFGKKLLLTLFSDNQMKKIIVIFFISLLFISLQSQAQQWNGHQCAVVLTYDDALDIDLDNVIPTLDSAGLKGTFYLIGESSVVQNRLMEWQMAAKHGHELGNHTLNHPCDGNKPDRSWVSTENDLSKYTVQRAINEIRVTNVLLQAIDGKTERTFAYPCGDFYIDTVNFYKSVEKEFVGARGVKSGFETINGTDLNNIYCFGISGQSGEELINLVKKAEETHSLIVFLFHGVGGGHSINVSYGAHWQLVQYLKQNKKDIWIAPMVDVAKYIRANKTDNKN